MKYLLWLLKAAIFFTLFAFALNNQHDATVYFFFGTHWRAPLVLVVLVVGTGDVLLVVDVDVVVAEAHCSRVSFTRSVLTSSSTISAP